MFRMAVMDFLEKHPSVYILIVTAIVILVIICSANCNGKSNFCDNSDEEEPARVPVISNPIFVRSDIAREIIPGFVQDDGASTESSDTQEEEEEANVDYMNRRSNLPRWDLLNELPRGRNSIHFPIVEGSDSSSDDGHSACYMFEGGKRNKRTGSDISLTETANDILYESMRSLSKNTK